MSFEPPQPDRSAERQRMIAEQLVNRGIQAPDVLAALERIPRELFVSDAFVAQAYADSALAIECGQTISQPYMVARMTELLELRTSDRVLEVGTGTGYQTAVLACLARHVYTVEWHLRLMTHAADRLRRLGLTNVSFRCGDGSLGWPDEAPFEAVLVTAGAPDVPAPLVAQLGADGRLVAPVGGAGDQTLVRVRKVGGETKIEEYFKCRFVKLLGAAGWEG